MSDDPMTPLRAAYVTQMQRTYAQSTRGIATPEQRRAWHDEANRLIAQHDRAVEAKALREFADLVEEIANLGANNTGLRTPRHLAEYTRNYANRIESQETP